MFTLIRLLLLLLTRLWGWLIIGAVLIIIGIVLGASSHQVAYQTIDQGSFTPYVVNDGSDYLQTNGSTYYVINESEMSPSFNGLSIFKKSQTFSMITRTDSQTVDVQLSDGTHLQGTGYKVEKIDVLDSSGNAAQSFVDSEYTKSPHGFFENNWPGGILLIILGLMAGGLAFFLPQLLKRKLQRSPKAAPALAGTQGQAAFPAQANPYMQPYQNPSQYPGYGQQPAPNQPYQPSPPNQNPAQQYPQQYPSQYPQQQSAYPSYPQYTDPAQYQQPGQQQPQQGSYEKTQLANPYDYPDQGRS